MGKVNVVIVDATGNKEQKVGLPDDIKCGIIMVKLVEKIKSRCVITKVYEIMYKLNPVNGSVAHIIFATPHNGSSRLHFYIGIIKKHLRR